MVVNFYLGDEKHCAKIYIKRSFVVRSVLRTSEGRNKF